MSVSLSVKNTFVHASLDGAASAGLRRSSSQLGTWADVDAVLDEGEPPPGPPLVELGGLRFPGGAREVFRAPPLPAKSARTPLSSKASAFSPTAGGPAQHMPLRPAKPAPAQAVESWDGWALAAPSQALAPAVTTAMLRNLPCGLTRDDLLQILDREGFAGLSDGLRLLPLATLGLAAPGGAGGYDFVYVPMDFKRRLCKGYSFVNMVAAEHLQRLVEVFDGYSRWSHSSMKVCQASLSHTQGLTANVERYRDSPVMDDAVPDIFKPALFVGKRQVRELGGLAEARAAEIQELQGKLWCVPVASAELDSLVEKAAALTHRSREGAARVAELRAERAVLTGVLDADLARAKELREERQALLDRIGGSERSERQALHSKEAAELEADAEKRRSQEELAALDDSLEKARAQADGAERRWSRAEAAIMELESQQIEAGGHAAEGPRAAGLPSGCRARSEQSPEECYSDSTGETRCAALDAEIAEARAHAAELRGAKTVLAARLGASRRRAEETRSRRRFTSLASSWTPRRRSPGCARKRPRSGACARRPSRGLSPPPLGAAVGGFRTSQPQHPRQHRRRLGVDIHGGRSELRSQALRGCRQHAAPDGERRSEGGLGGGGAGPALGAEAAGGPAGDCMGPMQQQLVRLRETARNWREGLLRLGPSEAPLPPVPDEAVWNAMLAHAVAAGRGDLEYRGGTAAAAQALCECIEALVVETSRQLADADASGQGAALARQELLRSAEGRALRQELEQLERRPHRREPSPGPGSTPTSFGADARGEPRAARAGEVPSTPGPPARRHEQSTWQPSPIPVIATNGSVHSRRSTIHSSLSSVSAPC
ncbi:unnamed protein product, partial [Prorocentrum cordatum]